MKTLFYYAIGFHNKPAPFPVLIKYVNESNGNWTSRLSRCALYGNRDEQKKREIFAVSIYSSILYLFWCKEKVLVFESWRGKLIAPKFCVIFIPKKYIKQEVHTLFCNYHTISEPIIYQSD